MILEDLAVDFYEQHYQAAATACGLVCWARISPRWLMPGRQLRKPAPGRRLSSVRRDKTLSRLTHHVGCGTASETDLLSATRAL
jgi:hypothetical protein